MIYPVFKHLAFRFDPEWIHQQTLSWLHQYPQMAALFGHPSLDHCEKYQIQVGGLTWPFPVGLAAGLDKDARAIPFFSRLLFGAVEVGTVTPKAQWGNPTPRLFRLTEEESLRNQLGFNNQGMEAIFRNLIQHASSKCLGVNLGKNKNTPPEQTLQDYRLLYERFAPVADYLVVNISSPNTPGLRSLQERSGLANLLEGLQAARASRPCPLFVKISPDISFESADAIVELAHTHRLAGLIAGNTTVMDNRGPGGISGRLLYPRAQSLRSHLLQTLRGYPNLSLIGVGGFSSFQEIREYWEEGGGGVQIYTALIYQGPKLLLQIKQGIDQLLAREKMATLADWMASRRQRLMQ